MSYIGLSLLFGLYDDLKILLVDRNHVDDLITVLLCCMESYVHKAFWYISKLILLILGLDSGCITYQFLFNVMCDGNFYS